MRVGVGFSDNPDSLAGGAQAAAQAERQAERRAPCDLVLLFNTARHDPVHLWNGVTSVLGDNVPIVGGGAVGAMTNSHFGYAGDQVGLAAIWLDNEEFRILPENSLRSDEEIAGERLGKKLLDAGVGPETSVMLFYDAIDRTGPAMRMLMATPLLAGLEKAMGVLPNLVGAGLQGDFACTPTRQWIGGGPAEHQALALAFSKNIRIDSVIMHGCRPSTGYYTVTKADRQTILEINHEPALRFVHKLLGPTLPVEEYAFFLIFGINRGDKWAPYDENNYASRLCLAIDKARNGIVMFEPDMVEGTRFQIMHRALDLDYMAPRIQSLFDIDDGSRPVFAFYIDCAGRAAGYAGTDLEDAYVVQDTVAGRTPLLGIYSGVEIAPVLGVPRPLDWTGVFCLFRETS